MLLCIALTVELGFERERGRKGREEDRKEGGGDGERKKTEKENNCPLAVARC